MNETCGFPLKNKLSEVVSVYFSSDQKISSFFSNINEYETFICLLKNK